MRSTQTLYWNLIKEHSEIEQSNSVQKENNTVPSIKTQAIY